MGLDSLMQAKKWHRFKLTEGSSILLAIFLFTPFLLRLWFVLSQSIPTYHSTWGNWLGWLFIFLICFFGSAFVWGFTTFHLIKKNLWKLASSWYSSCFTLAILYFFYAVFIFITGYTPTKYGSHQIARSAGFYFVYQSIIPAIIGLIAYTFRGKEPQSPKVKVK